MSASVLGTIEAAARRVDVDDLVALAAALDVELATRARALILAASTSTAT